MWCLVYKSHIYVYVCVCMCVCVCVFIYKSVCVCKYNPFLVNFLHHILPMEMHLISLKANMLNGLGNSNSS